MERLKCQVLLKTKQKFLPDRCREFVLANITVKKSLSPQELCWHLVMLSYTVSQVFQEISTNVAIGLYITFCRVKLHICPRNQVNSFWVPFLFPIPHFVPTTCTDNNNLYHLSSPSGCFILSVYKYYRY